MTATQRPAPSVPATPHIPGPTPEAVATDLLAHLEQAWNRSDGGAFGAALTEDADFVDIRGTHHQGRPAISVGHQIIFDTIYAGSTVRYRLARARELAPGCVVAVASATLVVPDGPLRGTKRSCLTVTATERAEGWRLASFHNTLVEEAT